MPSVETLDLLYLTLILNWCKVRVYEARKKIDKVNSSMTKFLHKYETHKLIKEYYSYIITVLILVIYDLFMKIDYKIDNSNYDMSLSTTLEIPLFVFCYLYLLKKTSLKNKYLKIFLTVFTISFLFTIIEMFFSNMFNPSVSENSFLDFILEGTYEMVDIILILLLVSAVSYINKNFLLTHVMDYKRGFLANIPNENTEDIFLIKASENYIEVYYKNNIKLIQYRLKNAILEMPADIGIQVHRSYWVNKKFIIKLEKENKKRFITLKNGMQIPVGSSYQKYVENIF